MKDNNQNNNSQPVVLGELKKEKSSKPILAIIIFALLLGTCFGLPYIKDYLNTENNKVTELYQTIKNYFNKDNTVSKPNQEEKKESVITTLLCKNQVVNNYTENLEYTYTFTDNKLTKVTETKTVTKTQDETLNNQIKNSYQALSDKINKLTKSTSTLNDTETSIEIINQIDQTDLISLNNANYFSASNTYEEIKTDLTTKGYTCQ